MQQVEEARGGRRLIVFMNFDRESRPTLPGIATQFASDTKEALFRVLRESAKPGDPIDLMLYTRGGDTNSVWPIVSLLREFDPNFEVLVPYRCHSAGTLLALGAARVVMGPLSELSPIDPTTGNQFNPSDPQNSQARLGISVEDVTAYRSFLLEQFRIDDEDFDPKVHAALLQQGIATLSQQVHPLALGNVQRVHQQIRQLARRLLKLHAVEDEQAKRIVDDLTTRFYSHLHMINRHEASEILGNNRVLHADEQLSGALDNLLRAYEDTFLLRTPFLITLFMDDDGSKDARFIGAAIESRDWSYLFETSARLKQRTDIPPNVQIQIPPGQPMPLVPGLPRKLTSICFLSLGCTTRSRRE
jgi:hypothetical protein